MNLFKVELIRQARLRFRTGVIYEDGLFLYHFLFLRPKISAINPNNLYKYNTDSTSITRTPFNHYKVDCNLYIRREMLEISDEYKSFIDAWIFKRIYFTAALASREKSRRKYIGLIKYSISQLKEESGYTLSQIKCLAMQCKYGPRANIFQQWVISLILFSPDVVGNAFYLLNSIRKKG